MNGTNIANVVEAENNSNKLKKLSFEEKQQQGLVIKLRVSQFYKLLKEMHKGEDISREEVKSEIEMYKANSSIKKFLGLYLDLADKQAYCLVGNEKHMNFPYRNGV